jgi:predicted porin
LINLKTQKSLKKPVLKIHSHGEILMNKKILSFAVAATLVVPMASYADVRVSGLIQAEAASWEVGDEDSNAQIYFKDKKSESDRQMLTNDSLGTILNEGPNHLRFDFDEKLGAGLSAFARYDAAFNTSGNFGSSIIGEEAWVGLKTTRFYFRYGTLTGAYKSSHTLIDPWAFTSLQTRGTAGGMSGNHYHKVSGSDGTLRVDTFSKSNGGGMGLTNEGFVQGALEMGFKFGGFRASIQGVVDETSDMDGAGLLELRYKAPNFAMWLSGAFTDLDLEGTVKDIKDDVSDTIDDVSDAIDEIKEGEFPSDVFDEEEIEEEDGGRTNWKIGGNFKLGPSVKLGLQYEDAEMGTIDGNPDGGQYILGSLEVKPMSSITLAAWVSSYMSDMDDKFKMVDDEGSKMGEDALSWALGGKYHFSKRTQIYLGYRQTDSDNKYRDENVYTAGIRHIF